jgi:drug/metabolite transporter (DMT)-like permease
MIDWKTLGIGFAQAGIDVFALSFVKMAAMATSKSEAIKLMILPLATYFFQPVITFFALKLQSLTITNIVWDLTSDILVSLIGIFYFKEKLGRVRIAGLLVGMIALVLLAQKDGFEDD